VLLKLGATASSLRDAALPVRVALPRAVDPVFAVIGILYGAVCAWVQRDVKKLVAYSSVSHSAS